MKNYGLLAFILVMIISLCACAVPAKTQPSPSAAQSQTVQPTSTPAATPTPVRTPVPTTQPDIPQNEEVPEQTQTPPPEQTEAQTSSPEQTQQSDTPSHQSGEIRIHPGDTLARDIIPDLCDIFALSEDDVKDILSDCSSSKLINESLSDFRRMEGIIPPGTYTIEQNISLAQSVNNWISEAEQRYDRIVAACANVNDLPPDEQMSLAAVVEWECLPNKYYAEVATVLLNRLDKGSKLRCCTTTEYALGFERPYLTSEDIKIQSKYNTYVVKGVPIGPICVVADDALLAAVSKKQDSDIYYFFNDYALHEMFFFSDYDQFKADAYDSRDLFEQTYDIDPYGKVDKKDVFGYD